MISQLQKITKHFLINLFSTELNNRSEDHST